MMDLREYKVSKNIITYLEKTSVVSEAYRILRTNIQYASIDKRIKSIVITSPEVCDGKTVTACNLAVSMANSNNKVLLIDCDLRKPSIHNQFKISNCKGISNLLLMDIDIEDCLINSNDINNLTLLTSGTISSNPSELISSNKMRKLLEQLVSQFDIVIMDTPPLRYASDGVILGSMADGVILAIASGETNISLAKQATKALRNVDANILGAIMTKIHSKNTSY